jgi:hypothetical protein
MRIPAGGYALTALNRPLVLALLVAAPLLWLLSGWLFRLAREDDLRPTQHNTQTEREQRT